MQFAHLFVHRLVRSTHHQVFCALVHREQDHVAQIVGIGQQHNDAVNTRSTTTVRWGAILERINHTAKTLFNFVSAVACYFKGFEHDLWLMISDRT